MWKEVGKESTIVFVYDFQGIELNWNSTKQQHRKLNLIGKRENLKFLQIQF